jgi:hypothetical protein
VSRRWQAMLVVQFGLVLILFLLLYAGSRTGVYVWFTGVSWLAGFLLIGFRRSVAEALVYGTPPFLRRMRWRPFRVGRNTEIAWKSVQVVIAGVILIVAGCGLLAALFSAR